MKERSILFAPEMVRKIIAGEKSQTRRVMKDSDWYGCPTGDCPHWKQEECDRDMAKACPFGKVGDRLWVRETFGFVSPEWQPDRPAQFVREFKLGRGYFDGHVIYRADGEFTWWEDERGEFSAWKPSIHMNRELSRILLEITGIRAERMQDGENDEYWPAKTWAENPWVWVVEFKRIA